MRAFNIFSSVVLFPAFSKAQASFDPLSNPGCSTVESIVQSCAPKIATEATVSSVVFSCICYDGSGNYAPTIYGDAATACTNYILSAYSTQGNAFVAYAAGFCTNPSFAPVATTPVDITPTATSVGVASSSSAAAGTGTTSISATILPGGSISSSSSSPTASGSALTTSVVAPATTKGSSGSGSGSSSSSSASVASTSSKAEGAKMTAAVREGSLWSIFGSLVAAVFVL